MKYAILIILLVFSCSVNAFSVQFKQGVNQTIPKSIIQDTPINYFDGLDLIIFTNKPHPIYDGYYSYRWKKDRITRAEIIIYESDKLTKLEMQCLLLHELGHHDEIMNYFVHQSVLSEDYAWKFAAC